MFVSRGFALIVAIAFLPVIQAYRAASTFLLDDGSGQNFTFSLNIPAESHDDDLYFHFSGSNGYSWLAVGCGSQMKGSMIFSVYTSTVANNVTVSARIADGHREPTYDSDIKLDLMAGTALTKDAYVVNARCRNCRKWSGGAIDLTATGQPWIYAFGPNENLMSTSPSAMMRRHNTYGHFNMNMKLAQGDAGVPTGDNLTTMFGATADGKPHSDHEVGVPLHALFMAGSFVILLPLGVLFVAVMGRVRIHLILQTIATVAITAGFGIGLYESSIQNRTRSVRQPHQIIGIITWIFVLAQTASGYIQHRQHKITGVKSPISKVHRIAGVVVICFGLINGGLGFQLGSDSPYTDHGGLYGIIIAVLVIIVAAAYLWRNRYRRRHEALNSPAARNFQQGLAEEREAEGREFPLQDVSGGPPPPAYSRPL